MYPAARPGMPAYSVQEQYGHRNAKEAQLIHDESPSTQDSSRRRRVALFLVLVSPSAIFIYKFVIRTYVEWYKSRFVLNQLWSGCPALGDKVIR